MQALFSSFYLVVIAIYLLLSIFIIFHIARYSINKSIAFMTIVFFIVGTVLLLSINAIYFSHIPFEKIKIQAAPQKF
jgi:hypothetical protein